MSELIVTSEQEKQIFREVLKRDFVFRLQTANLKTPGKTVEKERTGLAKTLAHMNEDQSKNVALSGVAKDFSYTANAANSYVIGQLINLGVNATGMLGGLTGTAGVMVSRIGANKIKFTYITVHKNELRNFVEKTGVDFPGKKELFPDLA